MKEVVVDAFVAAKWVIEETYSAQAAQLLQYDARYAPEHWQAEAVNVLWSKVFKVAQRAGRTAMTENARASRGLATPGLVSAL